MKKHRLAPWLLVCFVPACAVATVDDDSALDDSDRVVDGDGDGDSSTGGLVGTGGTTGVGGTLVGSGGQSSGGSSSGGSSSGGNAGVGGNVSTGGAAGVGGAQGSGGSDPDPDPDGCVSKVKNTAHALSTEEVCFKAEIGGELNLYGWRCQDCTGRTLTINGVATPIPSGFQDNTPRPGPGPFLFRISGAPGSASFTWW